MMLKRNFTLLFCGLLFGGALAASQPATGRAQEASDRATSVTDGKRRHPAPEVHARFSADTIEIGDQFLLEIDIDKDLAQEIQLLSFDGADNQLVPKIEVLGIDRLDTLSRSGRREKLRVTYRLTGFDAGSYAVAGIPVVWSATSAEAREGRADTVRVPELLRIEVRGFDIDTATYQLCDIKRPIHTPLLFAEIRELVYWSVASAAVLAGVIYLVIRYLQRRRRRGAPKRIVPPHVTAIRALEKLHSRKLWQNGKYKEYYSQLVDIVRVYIEGRYGIGAMEMTSDEILGAMREVNDARLCEKLRGLFSPADLVKFAKLAPAAEDNEQAYFDAYFYVEETKAMPEAGEGHVVAPGATATEAGRMFPAEEDETVGQGAVEGHIK